MTSETRPDSHLPSDSPTRPVTQVTLRRIRSLEPPETIPDEVATEEPLEIRIDGRGLAVLMRTPGRDRELAAGFLCSEGLVSSPDAILDITRCEPISGQVEPNAINVLLHPDHLLDWSHLQRHTFASSSCGICGKATIESIRQSFPPVETDLVIGRDLLASLPRRLRQVQKVFNRTGGLHAAGVFDPQGECLAAFEDVGRHNAVDKLIGSLFLEGRLPLNRAVLLLSGRVSFEVVQKALSAGIAMVAAVSAPTSLAVAFAESANQTLIGFLRDDRMNVYTHPGRVVG